MLRAIAIAEVEAEADRPEVRGEQQLGLSVTPPAPRNAWSSPVGKLIGIARLSTT